MSIVANRHFNDPNIARGVMNIADMFKPLSGSDTYGYAKAAAEKAQAERIAQLYREAPDFEGRSIIADLYDPSQSFTAVNTDAATKLKIAELQEAGSMARQFAQPVLVNEGQTAFLPAQTAAATSLAPMFTGAISADPGEQITTPDGRMIAGAPKPLSLTELEALILGSQPEADQRAKVLGDIPVEQIVGPAGTPQFARRSDAVGMEPFVNKGAEAKPTNAIAQLQDGSRVSARQGADGRWVHAQTNEPLPDNVQIFDIPKPQGTNEEIGLGKPAANEIEKRLIDARVAKNTAVRLRDMIQSAPASQGAVGWLRGTAQNVIQAGGEVGAYFGGSAEAINKRIANGLEDASLAGFFDTNIPAIEMTGNLLAFQYAKMSTGERLSNEMLRNAKAALGLDALTANQADAVARLNMAVSLIEDQERIFEGIRTEGLGRSGAAAPPTTTGAAAPIPTVSSEAEIEALPSGSKFITPDGKTRIKP